MENNRQKKEENSKNNPENNNKPPEHTTLEEIADFLWLRLSQIPKQLWPLIGLLLSGICTYWYATTEGISLDLTSSLWTLGLAFIGFANSFFVILFIIMSLISIAVLLINFNKDEKNWILLFEETSPRNSKRLKLTLFWLSNLILLVLLVNLMAWVSKKWIGFENALWNVGLVALLFLAVAGLLMITIKAALPKKTRFIEQIKPSEIPVFLSVTFVQLFLVVAISQIALRVAQNFTWADNHFGWVSISILIAFGFGLFQLVFALLVNKIKGYKNPIKIILLSFLLLMIFICLTPSLGGKLAGLGFQLVASGGRVCTVLQLGENTQQDVNFLRDPMNPHLSQPLKMLIYMDEQYQVRFWKDPTKDVYFVSKDAIVGMRDCKKEEK